MKKGITIIFLFSNLFVLAQPVLNESNYDPNFFANVFCHTIASGIGVGLPANGENVTWNYSSFPTTPCGTYMTIPLNTDLLGAFPTATYADSFQQNSYSVHKIYSLNSIEHKTIAVQYNDGSWNPFICESQIFPYNYQDVFCNVPYLGYGTLITPFSTHENVIMTKETWSVHLSVAGYFYRWYSINPYRLIAMMRSTPTFPYSMEFYEYNNLSSNDNTKNNEFEIYPNPTNGDLFIRIGNDLQANYFSIYDITGKELIQKEKIDDISNKINLTDFSSGIYFIKIYDKKGQIVGHKKIVKN
ncbi:MAG: T9SS type A sorting domain-containing protein [Flavobacterium sp.]|uniref:T9SS type A sorting domain-containing protein n=1 Tax=Flavobacterium sp. TaxID=239 RepID=UPI0022BAF6F0|nr:T9SS type A sorting domain-containing protein [Flavobacterium sp.]MCZ8197449.1 T9SS type A sorting domain-containing protein [Flavobacterium sp.]